jgi:hypothetical protein
MTGEIRRERRVKVARILQNGNVIEQPIDYGEVRDELGRLVRVIENNAQYSNIASQNQAIIADYDIGSRLEKVRVIVRDGTPFRHELLTTIIGFFCLTKLTRKAVERNTRKTMPADMLKEKRQAHAQAFSI